MKLSLKGLMITLLIGFLLAGCGAETTMEPTVVVQPSATQVPPTATATSIPPTPTELPPPTETPTPTPRPIATTRAEVGVTNLNLRAGPSTIYAILGSYPEGTEILVVARVPGNEWVRVQTEDGASGWMAAELLDIADEVAYLPLEEVTESIVISGRVIDSDAKPVDGVDVAVLQRLTDVNLRTDAVTDQDGYFYAYIPTQSAGIWEAQIVGVLCTSRIMDENCSLKDHFLYNYRVIFEPPPISPILFFYQVSDVQITGQLVNADGEPVSLRVFAERNDGAYAYAQADENGNFSIPAGPGIWRVYAIQYNPNLEGAPVTVQIVQGEALTPITINAPVPES